MLLQQHVLSYRASDSGSQVGAHTPRHMCHESGMRHALIVQMHALLCHQSMCVQGRHQDVAGFQ